MRVFALATLVLLAACGTPQEQCIARETRDLRILDRLIVETEGNLARGYAIEEYTVEITVVGRCAAPGGFGPDGQKRPAVFEPCLRESEVTRTRPKAIDLGAERRKLLSMQAKRRDLARDAAEPIAACKAQFPE
jgi:hypothetical protein